MSLYTYLVNELHSKRLTEHFPRYILIFDATPEEEHKILTETTFWNNTMDTIQYYKLSDGVFYTDDTHGKTEQQNFLTNILGHSNYVIAEIFGNFGF